MKGDACEGVSEGRDGGGGREGGGAVRVKGRVRGV